MPTYDYVCGACGHRLEVVHGIHGHGPSVCPVCGGPMRKAFVAPAVHYKGSGWAKKDRSTTRSTKAAAKAAPGGSETAESGGSDGGSVEKPPSGGTKTPEQGKSTASIGGDD